MFHVVTLSASTRELILGVRLEDTSFVRRESEGGAGARRGGRPASASAPDEEEENDELVFRVSEKSMAASARTSSRRRSSMSSVELPSGTQQIAGDIENLNTPILATAVAAPPLQLPQQQQQREEEESTRQSHGENDTPHGHTRFRRWIRRVGNFFSNLFAPTTTCYACNSSSGEFTIKFCDPPESSGEVRDPKKIKADLIILTKEEATELVSRPLEDSLIKKIVEGRCVMILDAQPDALDDGRTMTMALKPATQSHHRSLVRVFSRKTGCLDCFTYELIPITTNSPFSSGGESIVISPAEASPRVKKRGGGGSDVNSRDSFCKVVKYVMLMNALHTGGFIEAPHRSHLSSSTPARER